MSKITISETILNSRRWWLPLMHMLGGTTKWLKVRMAVSMPMMQL